ncbi:carboxy methyl transferase for protein phosphatase 2A [Neofusicoccum ribis]|uniref:Leucine carboxyl methyltransferase 1 n=1 Tax=Neofusicoccum ribis TaxID=45134 RepID=A0ABR3SXR4_9PEZI
MLWGTYVRTTAIDRLVERFLATSPDQPKQIVSLGAGSDTRFFRILSTRSSAPLVYHEIDFPANTRQKISAIKRTPTLLSVITSHLANPAEVTISDDFTSLHSPVYNVHPLDLRSLASKPPEAESSASLPELPNISPTTPTLILSECCLIYLPPDDADSIVANLTARLIPAPTPLSIILYEPIKPNDSFGKVMISNLARRGIVLQTLKKYSSLYRQCERLKRSGFASGQAAAEVDFIWKNWITDVDMAEIDKKVEEHLDEVEELLKIRDEKSTRWSDGLRGGKLELVHARIDEAPTYETISYVWGGSDKSQNVQLAHDLTLPLTETLHRLLP